MNHCTFPQLYGALWHLSAPCFGFTATSLNLDAALAASFPVPVPTCFQLKNSSGWAIWRYLPCDSRKCARWNRFGSRLASLNTKRTRSVGGAAAAALNSTAIDAAGYTGRESSAEVCVPQKSSLSFTQKCVRQYFVRQKCLYTGNYSVCIELTVGGCLVTLSGFL